MDRYKRDLYTPGSSTPGKEVVRFNQSVQDDYSDLQGRQRELDVRLIRVNNEIEQAKKSLVFLVIERSDFQEACKRLAELRAEAEALQLGIDALRYKALLLKRSNSWL